MLFYFCFHICGETFQHPMNHVHIVIILITMLEIVFQKDNFLTILMGIWTHRSLDRGTTAILIPITWHGANSLISHCKLKLLKIMLHNFMNSTINHIRSSMVKYFSTFHKTLTLSFYFSIFNISNFMTILLFYFGKSIFKKINNPYGMILYLPNYTII